MNKKNTSSKVALIATGSASRPARRMRGSRAAHVAHYTRALFTFIALAGSASSHAAETEPAKSPCAKVDAGYAFDDSVRGAFGSPSPVEACIDVLRAQDDEPRRLRIFVGGKRVLSDDAVAMGPDEGGVRGDPFQPLQIHGGSLVVQNAGGGGVNGWTETWHLTMRNGQWIVAGWDEESSDMHSAADGGGESHTSVNALTGDIHDSYEPPDDDDHPAKRPVRHVCKLPPEWRSPAIAQVEAIRARSWYCDEKLAKPIDSGS
jgi:hypothetical protein